MNKGPNICLCSTHQSNCCALRTPKEQTVRKQTDEKHSRGSKWVKEIEKAENIVSKDGYKISTATKKFLRLLFLVEWEIFSSAYQLTCSVCLRHSSSNFMHIRGSLGEFKVSLESWKPWNKALGVFLKRAWSFAYMKILFLNIKTSTRFNVVRESYLILINRKKWKKSVHFWMYILSPIQS